MTVLHVASPWITRECKTQCYTQRIRGVEIIKLREEEVEDMEIMIDGLWK